MWGLSETIDTTPYGSPRLLASADLDWNGHADLAIGLDAGGVLLYGAPISVDYQPFFQLATTNGIKAIIDIAIGDIDRDGLQDIVVVDSGTNVNRIFAVFGDVRRDANEALTRLVTTDRFSAFVTPHLPTEIELGDLDRDGTLDIAVAFRSNDRVGLVRSQSYRSGAVIVDTVATGSTVDGPNSLSLADLNHDGWMDMAVSRNSVAGTLRIGSVLTTPRVDCDLTWVGAADAPTYDYPLITTATSDIDGDGRTDLVHAIGDGSNDGGAVIAYGRGSGRFAATEDGVFASTGRRRAPRWATSTTTATRTWRSSTTARSRSSSNPILHRTHRSRRPGSRLPALLTDNGLIVADVDLDRRDDLVWLERDSVLGDSTIHVFLQGANGTFVGATTAALAIGDNAYGLSLADVNLDGTLDFAFTTFRSAQQTQSLCTLLSTGPSSWPAALTNANCTLLRDGVEDLYVNSLRGFVNVGLDPAPGLVIKVGSGNSHRFRSAPSAPRPLGPHRRRRRGGHDARRLPALRQRWRVGVRPLRARHGERARHRGALPEHPDARGVRARRRPLLDHAERELRPVPLPRLARGRGLQRRPQGRPRQRRHDVPAGQHDGQPIVRVRDLQQLRRDDGRPRRQRLPGCGGVRRFDEHALHHASERGRRWQLRKAGRHRPRGGPVDGPGGRRLRRRWPPRPRGDVLRVEHQQRPCHPHPERGPGHDLVREHLRHRPQLSLGYTRPVAGDFDANGYDDVAFVVYDLNGGAHVRFQNQYAPGSFSPNDSSGSVMQVNDLASGRLRKPTWDSADTEAVALAGTCGQTNVPCVVIVSQYRCEGSCDIVELFPKNPDSIGAIAVGDLNRDGLDDIAITQGNNGDDYPTVFLQSAAGMFSEFFPAANATPMFKGWANALVIVDADRDGYGDLVARTSSYSGDYRMDSIEVVPNAGGQQFALSTATRIESFGYVADSLIVGDLVRSGRPALGGAHNQLDQLRIKK